MPQSSLRFFKTKKEFIPKDNTRCIPKGLRGIYVLYMQDEKTGWHNVVYIGLATNGFKGRLNSHKKSPTKSKKWNCCSIFEVWENVRDEEIKELEGMFRYIYRQDKNANILNVQRGYEKLKSLPPTE